jgi:16S rRNA C967 or C1407 C5-methylase (RsmB/RsmF family)
MKGDGEKRRGDKGWGRIMEVQKKIILRGFDLLNKGGAMLYSTCTYNPGENEGVIDFLLKSRDAELLPLNLDMDHEPGITAWEKERYDSHTAKAARFYPHRIESVGFFMARIGRRG